MASFSSQFAVIGFGMAKDKVSSDNDAVVAERGHLLAPFGSPALVTLSLGSCSLLGQVL